jgi:hypothetical protein
VSQHLDQSRERDRHRRMVVDDQDAVTRDGLGRIVSKHGIAGPGAHEQNLGVLRAFVRRIDS